MQHFALSFHIISGRFIHFRLCKWSPEVFDGSAWASAHFMRAHHFERIDCIHISVAHFFSLLLHVCCSLDTLLCFIGSVYWVRSQCCQWHYMLCATLILSVDTLHDDIKTHQLQLAKQTIKLVLILWHTRTKFFPTKIHIKKFSINGLSINFFPC